jgi:ATP-binding cassette, subfamily A (ABC1), member 3
LQQLPTYDNVTHVQRNDQTIYSLADSAKAADFLRQLEKEGLAEYQLSGPTIEDVFLKVAEEVENDEVETEIEKHDAQPHLEVMRSHNSKEIAVDGMTHNSAVDIEQSENQPPRLLDGTRISIYRQALALFNKRGVVLRRNSLPYVAAVLIPIIAAGLVTLFMNGFQKAGCTPESNAYISDIISLSSQIDYKLVAGPPDRLGENAIELFAAAISGNTGTDGIAANTTKLLQSIHLVDTLTQFNDYIDNNYANVTPGGFFLGDDSSPATFAWKGNADISFPLLVQNFLDTILLNISISNQYQAFDQPWGADVGKALQLITYFGLAMSVYPSFFALYPTIERIRGVRALHYSNGVRAAPLWLAYTTFDFIIVLVTSAIAIIIFRAVSDVWYHIEYLFVVFFLYGLASTLLSYVISLFSRSQLAAFAFAAGGQAVMFL